MTQLFPVLIVNDNRSDRALVMRELQREFSQLQVQEILDARDFEQVIADDAFDAVITECTLLAEKDCSNSLRFMSNAEASLDTWYRAALRAQ